MIVWGRSKRARNEKRALGAALFVAKGGGEGIKVLLGIEYLFMNTIIAKEEKSGYRD